MLALAQRVNGEILAAIGAGLPVHEQFLAMDLAPGVDEYAFRFRQFAEQDVVGGQIKAGCLVLVDRNQGGLRLLGKLAEIAKFSDGKANDEPIERGNDFDVLRLDALHERLLMQMTQIHTRDVEALHGGEQRFQWKFVVPIAAAGRR